MRRTKRARYGTAPTETSEPLATDEQLVEQARGGEDAAFAALYRRHVRYVAGVLHRLLRADDDVEDLLQQTFADAYVGIHALREAADFRSWVARIAVRRAHDRMAWRRRLRWLHGALAHVLPRASNPADRQDVDELCRALDDLPPDLRIAWTLHVIEGETLERTARLCDVSLATVKRRIADAGVLIRRRLEAG